MLYSMLLSCSKQWVLVHVALILPWCQYVVKSAFQFRIYLPSGNVGNALQLGKTMGLDYEWNEQ